MTTTATPTGPAFRSLPYMGVIRVNVEAMKSGYTMGHPDWANLGQGQPEVGPIAGAPPRMASVPVQPEDYAYGPIEGIDELRERIAAHYNRLFRRGMKSQYGPENVAVASGGRLALSRLGAALDRVRLGYFTPDYTAYEDLLTTFDRIDPALIELRAEEGFRIDPAALAARVERDGIGALLISNPCNPTGVVVEGGELAAWVELARSRGCTLLMDEFYSHFRYAENAPVSAAAYVEDVERDPVVLVDGLTKCFRYPGWRVGWVVAPSAVIRTLAAAGSFLDGGPPRPIQRAAVEILEPKRADQETDALRVAFRAKRDLVVARLEALGVRFPAPPMGTFYAYGDVSGLPASIAEGERFMRAGIEHRVLTVPGAYFDVNPHRTRGEESPLASFVRFSYGPPMEVVKQGLDRIEAMVRAAR